MNDCGYHGVQDDKTENIRRNDSDNTLKYTSRRPQPPHRDPTTEPDSASSHRVYSGHDSGLAPPIGTSSNSSTKPGHLLRKRADESPEVFERVYTSKNTSPTVWQARMNSRVNSLLERIQAKEDDSNADAVA